MPALDRSPESADVSVASSVIAIDGPAGSGKSTVGRRLASMLGLRYLDTGAMYRGVTFAVLRASVDPSDTDAVAAIARGVELDLADGAIDVDGVDATAAIRGPEVTAAVSRVAANPLVREELVARQRRWAEERGGGVLEGRDIGTVVFPDALLKVYLTASPEVRAARRAQEMGEGDAAGVAADLLRRDTADSGRAASPLTVADGAVEIDTDRLEVDEVVDLVVALVEENRR